MQPSGRLSSLTSCAAPDLICPVGQSWCKSCQPLSAHKQRWTSCSLPGSSPQWGGLPLHISSSQVSWPARLGRLDGHAPMLSHVILHCMAWGQVMPRYIALHGMVSGYAVLYRIAWHGVRLCHVLTCAHSVCYVAQRLAGACAYTAISNGTQGYLTVHRGTQG